MGFFLWWIVTDLIIIALILLWNKNPAAKCVIKWALFSLISGVSATIFIPLMLLKPRDPKNALLPAAGLRVGSKFLGLDLKVEGTENIVKDSGCVVLINHQSFLDLVVLACLWPVMDNCTVISKKEILYLFPFGFASWLWGTIFIHRGSKDAQKSVNETGEIINKRKARVLVFPEGTRNLGKELLTFKKGAFHLALASRVPIQPVAVCRYTFLGNYKFENGQIRIKILPPISTEGMTKDDIPKLIDETYRVMSEHVSLLSEEGTQTNGISLQKDKNQ